MWRKLIRCGAFTLASATFAFPARAEIDPWTVEIQRTQTVPLRWDNVEGPPFLVGTAKLRKSGELHLVPLGDQPIDMVVPAGESLRVRAAAATLPQITAWISSTGGLYRAIDPRFSHDGREALIEPKGDQPLVVRLLSPAPAEAALFVSRHDLPAEAVAFRDRAVGDDRTATLAGTGRAWRESYRIMADQPTSFQAGGPARMHLRLRLLYPAQEPKSLRNYRVGITLDGKPWRDVLLSATQQRRGVSSVDGDTMGIGPESTVVLDLPAGHHTVGLASSAEILAELVLVDPDDFLFSGLNAPMPQIDGSVPLSDSVGARSAAAEKKAESLAWDQRLSGGGAAAAAVMAGQEAEAPRSPEIADAKRAITAQATTFRPVEPHGQPSTSTRTTATPIQPSLQDPLTRPIPALYGTEQMAHHIRNTATAIFHLLPGAGDALTYALPPIAAPTWLRLRVPVQDLQPSRLSLEIDGKRIPLLADTQPAGLRTSPDATETSILLGGIPEAPVEQVAAVDIPLPKGSRSVSIIADQPNPMRVALELRSSRSPNLDGQTYRSLLAGSPATGGKLLSAMAQVTRTSSDCAGMDVSACLWPPGTEAEARLQNDWLPLLRLVQSRASGFSRGIAPLPQTGEQNREQASIVERRARSFAAGGNHVSALEAWASVARHTPAQASSAAIRAEAWQETVMALERVGESFLAERILRSALLFEPLDGLAPWAYDRLRLRLAPEDFEARTALEAAWFSRIGRAAIGSLAEALALEGQSEPALKIAELLPAGERPHTALALAAEEAGWAASSSSTDPQTETIRKLLAAPERSARIEGARRWARWLHDHPGPKTWRTANGLIDTHAGSARLTVVGRDSTLTAYRAEPGRPVGFSALGPVTLRLEMRPVHPGRDFAPPLDVWATLDLDGTRRPVPISNNLPSSSLVLEGESARPGNADTRMIELPQGLHRVTLGSETSPLLVRLERLEPLAAPLPSLDPYVAENLIAGRFSVAMNPAAPAWHVVRASDSLPPAPSTPGETVLARIFPPAPLADGQRDSVHKLEALAWRLEHREDVPFAEIATGAALADVNASDPEIVRLWSRIQRSGLRWEPLSPIASAGVRTVASQGWQPGSARQRVRRALMPIVPDNSAIIGPGEEVVLTAGNQAIDGTIRPLAPAGSAAGTMIVELVRDGVTQSVTIPPEGMRLSATSDAALTLREAPAGHVVAFIPSPAMSEGFPLQETLFHMATSADPVVVSLDGPAWLRIDELRDGVLHSRNQSLPPGFHDLALKPEPGQKTALFKVFRQVPTGQPQTALAQPVPMEAKPLPMASAPDLPTADDPWVRFLDRLPLGGQEDGTTSIRSAIFDRPRSDADGAGGGANFTALEVGLSHRYFAPEQGSYWQADAKLRQDDRNQPLAGLEGTVQWPIGVDGMVASVGTEVAAQQIDAVSGAAWTGLGRVGLSQSWELSPKTSVRFSTDAFARYLSLSESEGRQAVPDPDVWSAFKADHRHGLGGGARLNHAPWRDSLGWVSLRADTTESPSDIDRFATTAGWSQMLGDFQLDGGYRLRRLLETDDRKRALWRNDLTLDVSWEHWLENSRRFEITLDSARQLETDETRFGLTFTLHLGTGRIYRDFAPGQVGFRALRELRAPETRWNNEVLSGDRP